MLIFVAFARLFFFIVQAVVKITQEMFKQVFQEVVEDLSNNENFFKEYFSFNPIYERYRFILESNAEEFAADNPEPTEEDIERFAQENTAQAVASLFKTWHVEPGGRAANVCPDCMSLDSEQINISESFSSIKAGQIKAPPLHPNCRCRISLDFEN